MVQCKFLQNMFLYFNFLLLFYASKTWQDKCVKMGELENGGAYVAVRSSVCIDRRHNVIYLHCEISK